MTHKVLAMVIEDIYTQVLPTFMYRYWCLLSYMQKKN